MKDNFPPFVTFHLCLELQYKGVASFNGREGMLHQSNTSSCCALCSVMVLQQQSHSSIQNVKAQLGEF